MANQNHNLYRIRNHNHYHNHSVLMFYKLLRLLKYILQLKTSHSQFRERNWGPMILFVIQNCILKIYFNRDWFTNDDDDDSRYWTLTESRLRILRQHMYSKLEVDGITCLRKKLMMVMMLMMMMIQMILRSKCFVTFPVSGLAWRTRPIKPESRWWARRRSNHKRFCLWNRPTKQRTETSARWQFVCGLSQWISTIFVSTNRRRIQQNT